jgi:hypothetical protein
VAIEAWHMLAGPILRRVEPRLVSVWCAFSRAVDSVELKVWRGAGARPASAPVAQGAARVVRVGGGLTIALAVAELPETGALSPEQLYSYDLDITADGTTRSLGDLGLLADRDIEVPRPSGAARVHRHLALGYAPTVLPSFATAPRRLDDLVIAHGSCRKAYAVSPDCLPALDDLIARAVGDPVARPHHLLLTGDQIYADDCGPELMRWLTALSRELIEGEHLRVALGIDAAGGDDPRDAPEADVVELPCDELHFPAGRRMRVCARAGNIQSYDAHSHVLGLGEYAALYLMMWSPVAWPSMTSADGTASELAAALRDRKQRVEAYLAKLQDLERAFDAQAIANQRRDKPAATYDTPEAERLAAIAHAGGLRGELRYEAAALLVDDALSAVDAHLTDLDARTLWAPTPAWDAFWPASRPAPRAVPFQTADPVLGRLAALLTPAWYAGVHHVGVSVDRSTDAPVSRDITADATLRRLGQLRQFYDGLPRVRRALANVPVGMMFDDHEATDNWNVNLATATRMRNRSLGRDLLRNALAAYALFQDWGNDPRRYAAGADPDGAGGSEPAPAPPNRRVLDRIGQLFFDGDQPRAKGPFRAPADELERLFGVSADAFAEHEQARWDWRYTGPGYELLALDNRTRRGLAAWETVPANLSRRAVIDQIPREPPAVAADGVTIVVAPMPPLDIPFAEYTSVEKFQLVTDPYRNPPSPPPAHWDVALDYEIGRLSHAEAYGLNPYAVELLLARLSTRKRVLFLSGEDHYAYTLKATYWRRTGTEWSASRIVQLTSSALRNGQGRERWSVIHTGLAQAAGVKLLGPYTFFGWGGDPQLLVESGPDDPTVGDPDDDHEDERPVVSPPGIELSYRVKRRCSERPILLSADGLPPGTTADRDPDWAWRRESMTQDARPDLDRIGDLVPPPLPDDGELAADPVAFLDRVGDRQYWQFRFAPPRGATFFANVGIVRFADIATAPRVIHELHQYDPRFQRPERARPYTLHEVSLDPADTARPVLPRTTP